MQKGTSLPGCMELGGWKSYKIMHRRVWFGCAGEHGGGGGCARQAKRSKSSWTPAADIRLKSQPRPVTKPPSLALRKPAIRSGRGGSRTE